MADKIKCADCESVLEFGGASASMRRQASVRAMLESMAVTVGWTRDGSKWRCRDHG